MSKVADRGAFYVSTFCNFAHALHDGVPLNHECYVFDPKQLQAEARGERINRIVKEPRRIHRGRRANLR